MIKLLKNRQQEQEPAAAATSWTRGEALKTAALRTVIWVLVACGPIGLGLAVATTAASQQDTAAAPATTEPAGRQQVAAFAQDAVVRWLRAHRGNEDTIAGIFPAKAELPKQPLNVSDPAVTETRWDEAGAWVVTVAVTINTEPTDEDQPGIAHRRYFQLPIRLNPIGSMTVLALPAEVTGPAVSADTRQTLGQPLASTDPLALTAADFLNALLAGVGDVTRYTSPEADVSPIIPAPYTEVSVESVHAQPAAEGAHTELLVRVRAASGESRILLEYVLRLVQRSGRWEVAAILGAPPPTASSEPSTTSHPTLEEVGEES